MSDLLRATGHPIDQSDILQTLPLYTARLCSVYFVLVQGILSWDRCERMVKERILKFLPPKGSNSDLNFK